MFTGMLRLTVPTGFTVATAFDACEARGVAYHPSPSDMTLSVAHPDQNFQFALLLPGGHTQDIYLYCIRNYEK